MEPGENQLKGAYALCGVHVHRNTPSVILNPDNIVILQSHGYLGAIAGHGLVYAVVHNLVYQMVQSGRACGTNIHTRSEPYRLKSFECPNIFGSIFIFHLFPTFLITKDIL